MDVSFIIPAYNVEKYIGRCLDSILSQPFTGKFEVIVVDDCSTDNTLSVALNYAKKDDRLKVIHHDTNCKLSQARATGFKASTGKYIWNVDSDDWIVDNILQSIYDKIESENLDVLLLKYISSDGIKIKDNVINRNQFDKKKEKEYFLGAIVTKFIRRTCVNDNYEVFTKSFNSGEDFIYGMELYQNAKNIGFYDKTAYYYFNCNETSITKSVRITDISSNFISFVIPLARKIKQKYNLHNGDIFDKYIFYYSIHFYLQLPNTKTNFPLRMNLKELIISYAKINGYKRRNLYICISMYYALKIKREIRENINHLFATLKLKY